MPHPSQPHEKNPGIEPGDENPREPRQDTEHEEKRERRPFDPTSQGDEIGEVH
jgi:hypothetical protein